MQTKFPFTFQPAVPLRGKHPVWWFSIFCLILLGPRGGGWEKVREENYSSAWQCLCLSLGLYPQQPLALFDFIFLHPSSLLSNALPPTYLSGSFTLRHNLGHPTLLPPARLFSPACVCAPVWLTACFVWMLWRMKKKKKHQVGCSWEEGWRKSACGGTAFKTFHQNPEICASFIRKDFTIWTNCATMQTPQFTRVQIWCLGFYFDWFLHIFYFIKCVIYFTL